MSHGERSFVGLIASFLLVIIGLVAASQLVETAGTPGFVLCCAAVLVGLVGFVMAVFHMLFSATEAQ